MDVEQIFCRFAEGVAGYAEEERQKICRHSDESSREAIFSVKNVTLAV
ncbi:MAG: hypothetical protein SPI30_01330 [Prevotella sp.]|nr:hypothetical protein [Prevotella sp.]